MIWFMLTIDHSVIVGWFTSFKILAREYSWRFLCSRKTKVKCPMIISTEPSAWGSIETTAIGKTHPTL